MKIENQILLKLMNCSKNELDVTFNFYKQNKLELNIEEIYKIYGKLTIWILRYEWLANINFEFHKKYKNQIKKMSINHYNNEFNYLCDFLNIEFENKKIQKLFNESEFSIVR